MDFHIADRDDTSNSHLENLPALSNRTVFAMIANTQCRNADGTGSITGGQDDFLHSDA